MSTQELEKRIEISFKSRGSYIANVKVRNKNVEVEICDSPIINAIKSNSFRFGVTKKEALLIIYKRAKNEI